MARQTANGNRVGRFFASLTDRVYTAVSNSFVGRFFTAYAESDGIFHRTACMRAMQLGRRKKKSSPLRRGMAQAMDRSFLRRACYALLDALCRCSLRTVGLFFLTVGAYTAMTDWLIASVWMGGVPDALGLFTGAAFALVGLLLLFSDSSVAHAVQSGVITGWFLRDVVGLAEDVFADMPHAGRQGYATAVPLGMAIGILTALTGPVHLLLVLIGIILALTIFTTPEAGVVIFLVYAPFIGFFPYGELWLAIGVALSLFGYFCKLLRGTRSFRMEVQDFAVLLMLAFTAVTAVSADEGAPVRALTAALLIAVYFPAVNTLATPQWLVRCRYALLGSATVASVIGVLQFIIAAVEAVVGAEDPGIQQLSKAVHAGFVDHTTFAYFLVLAFPFALYAFLRAKSYRRILAGLACVSIVAASAFAFVQSAWAALLAELIVLCLLCAKRFTPYLVMLLAAIPGIAALLPAAWRSGVARVMLESSDLSTARMGAVNSLVSGVFFEGGDGFFARGRGLLRMIFGLGNGGLEAICVLYGELTAQEIQQGSGFWVYRLAEGGVIGVLLPLILFLLVLQNCFSTFRMAVDKQGYALPAFAVVMVIGMLVFSVFRYSWYDPAALFLFFAIVAVFSADARHNRARNKQTEQMSNNSAFAELEYRVGEGRPTARKEKVNES